MNYLLGRTLSQFLDHPLSIIGIVLITAGIAMAVLSKRVTRVAHHIDDVTNDDKLYVALKVGGLILVGIGFLLVAINVIVYISNR